MGIKRVGVMRGYDGFYTPIFAFRNPYGEYECYFDNTLGGVMCAVGFDTLDFREVSDGSYEQLTDMLETQTWGLRAGVILLDDGFALINDIDLFDIDIAPQELDRSRVKHFTGIVDCAEVDFAEIPDEIKDCLGLVEG